VLHLSFFYTPFLLILFFFTATAPTEIYTLSLHDALPICILEEAGGTVLGFEGGADTVLQVEQVGLHGLGAFGHGMVPGGSEEAGSIPLVQRLPTPDVIRPGVERLAPVPVRRW